MNAVVDGKPQDWSSLTYRQLGFGQSLNGFCTELPYTLRLTVEELRSVFRQSFDAFVKDCKQDDEATGGADSVPLLKYNAYPTYDQLFQRDKGALAVLLGDLLALEMLEACFRDSGPSTWKFAINTVDNIQIEGKIATITGSAYHLTDAAEQ